MLVWPDFHLDTFGGDDNVVVVAIVVGVSVAVAVGLVVEAKVIATETEDTRQHRVAS